MTIRSYLFLACASIGLGFGSMGNAYCQESPTAGPNDSGVSTGRISVFKVGGKPLQGVKVYASNLLAGGSATLIGITNREGRTKPTELDWTYIGLAPNGHIGIGLTGNRIRFGSVGTVEIRLIDETGNPVVNKRIWLSPTHETQPVRSFGYFWGKPDYPSELEGHLEGVTDGKGDLKLPNLPKDVTFNVTIDPGLFSDMTYFGSVRVGKATKLLLAHDRQVSGRVFQLGTSKGISGITVLLKDTGYGHMGGYPGTVLRTAVTDRSGGYAFTNLPNCTFSVTLKAPREETKAPCMVDAKTHGNWQFEFGDLGPRNWFGTPGPWLWIKSKTNTCDFRLSAPCKISVSLNNPKHLSTKGWFVTTEEGGFSLQEQPLATFDVAAGRHKVSLCNPKGTEVSQLTVSVKPGSITHLEFSMPTKRRHT